MFLVKICKNPKVFLINSYKNPRMYNVDYIKNNGKRCTRSVIESIEISYPLPILFLVPSLLIFRLDQKWCNYPETDIR